MSVDDGGDVVLNGDIVDEVVDDNRSLRVESRVRLVAEEVLRIKSIARAMAARLIIPPESSDG